jgi:hypothetical protein
MPGQCFRAGNTKTTKAAAFEIVVETKPPAAALSIAGLLRLLRIPVPKLFEQTGNHLAPGPHRFQLVVEDELGRRSAPAIVVVTVLSQ